MRREGERERERGEREGGRERGGKRGKRVGEREDVFVAHSLYCSALTQERTRAPSPGGRRVLEREEEEREREETRGGEGEREERGREERVRRKWVPCNKELESFLL